MQRPDPPAAYAREGDPCPTCKTSTVVLCDCGQGDPAEHLVCLACGEDVPECDCARSAAYAPVAALFVETDGVYFGLPGVDPWDESRDARGYAGPYPVVAHPPCNKWSPLAYINRKRIPGYEIGDDGGCFAAALEAVRTYGGVLEHPAGSLAWKHYGLDRPERGIWKGYFGSYVTEVDQGSYGHVARKRTWLYVVGPLPPDLDWTIAESSVIVSGFTHQAKGEHVACEHRRVRPKEASRTPAAFRDVLLELARASRMAVAV